MANISHFTQTVNGVSTTYDIHDANAIPKTGSNQISGDLIPSTDGTVNLGSSSKKFASLNSIAPDELGLPTSTYTDVSSYITHLDYTANTFTAPVSGMLYVEGGGGDVIFENNTLNYMVNFNKNPHFNNCRAIIYIGKGEIISVYCNYTFLSYAKIYPLKGKI